MDRPMDSLRDIIEKEVLQDNYDQAGNWLFDFRRITLQPQYGVLIAAVCTEAFLGNRTAIQFGTIETAGIPLITHLARTLLDTKQLTVPTFYIRKSRKKSDACNLIEGPITKSADIILVDDVLNSGDSFWFQVEALEKAGYGVKEIWSLVQFRDDHAYDRFRNRGITVKSLFTLSDFTLPGSTTPIPLVTPTPRQPLFTPGWHFKSEQPSHQYVARKSQPCLDDTAIYVGSDHKHFWCLNQADGSVKWKFTIQSSAHKKAIFSDPVRYKDLVIFGAYDGNLYALEAATGAVRWQCLEADWIGSSPALAPDLGLVFIGLEFGILFKQGGIAAVSLKDGSIVWQDTHPAMTHGTPLYLPEHRAVVIGSNDGVVRAYDAKTGTRSWSFTTYGGHDFVPQKFDGFGVHGIKESPVYYPKKDWLIFGSYDGFLYILERATGRLVTAFKGEAAVCSTPTIYGDSVYWTSLDKHLYAADLQTLTLRYKHNLDGTRIYGRPVVIDGTLYVGTNAGRLHEIDLKTGTSIRFFQATERITNNLVHNPRTGQYFLPTAANEIIELHKVATA